MPPYLRLRFIHLFCLFHIFNSVVIPYTLNAETEDLWGNIPQDEIELQSPQIDKEAAAEILYSMQMLDDSNNKYTVYHYHKRIKIFKKSAIKLLSKIDLIHNDNSEIENIAARVIAKDASISRLNTEKIFEKKVYKKEGKEFFCKSFSFPSLEVGSIIEYKWTKRIRKGIKSTNRFNFLKEWPIHHSTFIFKPTSNSNWQIQTNGFDSKLFKKIAHKRYEISLYKLDSFPEEARTLPKHNLQKWLLIRYENEKEIEDSWLSLANKIKHLEKTHSSRSRTVRKKIRELTEWLEEDEAKVREIYKFCQNEIQNLSYKLHRMSINELSKTKKNLNAQDTIKHSYGTRLDINILFYSMLKTMGFDTKITLVSDTSNYLSDCQEYDPIALPCLLIHLSLNGKEYYCDPGTPFLEFGKLHQTNENVPALFYINNKAEFKRTPSNNEKHTSIKRIANLELQTNGSISGQVDIFFSGHENIILKLAHTGLSDKQIVKSLREDIQKRLPNAIISNCKISHLENVFRPIEYHYEIEIPSYSQKTKERIFVCHSFFEKGAELELDNQIRKSPIHIETGKHYQDIIQIKIPITHEINSPLNLIKEINKLHIKYHTEYSFDTKNNTLKYKRLYTESPITYKVEAYPEIRMLYKSIKKEDNKELVFKRKHL